MIGGVQTRQILEDTGVFTIESSTIPIIQSKREWGSSPSISPSQTLLSLWSRIPPTLAKSGPSKLLLHSKPMHKKKMFASSWMGLGSLTPLLATDASPAKYQSIAMWWQCAWVKDCAAHSGLWCLGRRIWLKKLGISGRAWVGGWGRLA